MAEGWMQSLLDDETCGRLPLGQMVLPASHDSGMWELAYHDATPLAPPSVTVTQTKSIFDQLMSGIRIFDVRPAHLKGEFYCVHYDGVDEVKEYAGKLKIKITSQGALGENIKDIVNSVNKFLELHKEFVVINIAGWGCVDAEEDSRGDKFTNMTQDHWRKLYEELQKLNHLFKPKDQKDLGDYWLNDIISRSSGAVAVIMHERGEWLLDELKLDGKGFFRTKRWFQRWQHYYLSQELSHDEIGFRVADFLLKKDNKIVGDIVEGLLIPTGVVIPFNLDIKLPIVTYAMEKNKNELKDFKVVQMIEANFQFEKENNKDHVRVSMLRPVIVIDAVAHNFLARICAEMNVRFAAIRRLKREDLDKRLQSELEQSLDLHPSSSQPTTNATTLEAPKTRQYGELLVRSQSWGDARLTRLGESGVW